MNSCLILLTNYFPFYKGEEYLETEIEYLAKEFSHIYILATMVDANEKPSRNVPNNVTILPSQISHSLAGKLKMFYSKYKEIRSDNKKREMINQDSGNSLIHRAYSYYFESRAMFIYEKLEEVLKQYDFSQYKQIVLYSYWFYITARVAVEFKNKLFHKQMPYVFTRAHGYDINIGASPVKFLPERVFLLEQLDNIYPCSQNGVDYLQSTYPDYFDKVSVRRLGTERDSNVNTANRTPFHIVSCSTVRKLKRLDLIIDALKIMEEKDIEITWTHLGGGPEFSNIISLANKELKKTKVNLIGFVSNEEVLQWYEDNSASLFINVSSTEGVPVSIMEALSMGLPVVATDAGGTSEIVDDGVNGYIIPVNCNGHMVAEKIIDVIRLDDEDYDKLSFNAIQIWNERCNAKKLYSSFAKEILLQSYSK